jgi:hypothetical protein
MTIVAILSLRMNMKQNLNVNFLDLSKAEVARIGNLINNYFRYIHSYTALTINT